MDAVNETTPASHSFERLICSSFPPLDPNGQPFSMVLRGTAAELGDLRAALSSHPNAPQQLQVALQMNAKDIGNTFEDVDVEGIPQVEENARFQDGCETNILQQAETEIMGDGNDERMENKKRSRDNEGDDDGIDDENECDDDVMNQEKLLFHIPSIQCTCSLGKMEDVPGDMLVTTLRVLFLPQEEYVDEQCNDMAIDGSCISLHAVDSLPEYNEGTISHHVYCQLAEPMGEESEMKYTSATSMVSATRITEENDENFIGDRDKQEEEEGQSGSSEEDGTIEVYFKPIVSDEEEKDGSESQSNKCQSIFDALTKLASLNPAGGSDEGSNGGGGLFSMLSLMAGINGFDSEMVVAGHANESDDDMVVRVGGSNNLVENDDGSESAPDDERRAMLHHLDNMLVVPPEYEIASSDDGQYDDAEGDEIL